MVKIECASCFFEFDAEDVMENEVIQCSDCGVNLEITAIHDNTVEIVVAEMSEEDWGE